jgi:hypothetical protein
VSLPFLRKNKEFGISQAVDLTDRTDEPSDGMHMVAKDIMEAIKADDHRAFAEALRAAFAIMESEPHDEVEHE